VDTQERFSSFVLACLLFAAINGVMSFYANDSKESALDRMRIALNPKPVDKTFMDWTTKDWLDRSPTPDVVLMGSSQMAAATFNSEATYLKQTIDCVQHRDIEVLGKPLSIISGHKVQVFNWSQSGAMMSDNYLIAANLFESPLKPATVVLGISPRDFIDNTLPCAGSTEAFRFFARYVDLGEYAAQGFPDPLSRLAWEVDNLPMQRLQDRFKILCRGLASEFPYLHSAGQTEVLQNGVLKDDDLIQVEPGKWCVSPNMPAYHDNTVEYLRRYKNPYPDEYKLQKQFFEKYLSLMRDRHISVMVIAMPSLSKNRALLPGDFWSQWRSYVTAQCNKYGDSWLDLSDSSEFTQQDYLDTVHLNAAGGKKLMNDLLAALTVNHAMLAGSAHTK
jgi:hypothetical protein